MEKNEKLLRYSMQLAYLHMAVIYPIPENNRVDLDVKTKLA